MPEPAIAIDNALASMAVNDIARAIQWYTALFGRGPDTTPMPSLGEWKFSRGGWLQVYQLPERAGYGSCTLAVSDLEKVAAHVQHLGIDATRGAESPAVKTLMIKDPDGNSIAFAEALQPGLAR